MTQPGDPVDLSEEYRALLREAEAFRQLKAAWDGPGGESDWLEFCQDFDWEVAASGKEGTL